MQQKKKSAVYYSNGYRLLLGFFGYTSELFFLTGFLTYIFTGDIAAAIVILIIMALCFLLILQGAKIKRRIKRYQKYLTIMSINQTTSLSLIASETAQSVDFIKSDIQIMVHKGYFGKAYIDYGSNELILETTPEELLASSNVQPVSPVKEKITVICVHCGAANTVSKNSEAVCEYCKLPLQK